MENLKAIPGLNNKTVEDLVAEIGLDMSVFPTVKENGRTNHANMHVIKTQEQKRKTYLKKNSSCLDTTSS